MASKPHAAGLQTTLADSKVLRLGMFFFLYFCQGLPIGLSLLALPAWLASKGADAAGIASVTSLALLPWGVKMFNGLIMERYAFLPMGRRRAWLVGAQLVICIALFAMFIAAPSSDDLQVIAGVLFAMNLAATFQDAAIDGIAVDVTPSTEHGRVNAFMAAGQAMGMSASGAVAGMLLNPYGLRGAVIPLLIFMIASMLTVCFITERRGERRLPWSAGQATAHASDEDSFTWLYLLKTVLFAIANKRVAIFLVCFLLYGVVAAMIDIAIPLFAVQELGWASERASNMMALGGVLGGLCGLLFLGYAADRWGIRRIGLLCFLSTALFWGVFALALPPAVQAKAFAPGYYSLSLASQGVFIAATALAMQLCRRDIAASQFALMMAVPNLSRVILQNGVDPLLDAGGYTLIWLCIAAASALAALFFFIAETLQRAQASPLPEG